VLVKWEEQRCHDAAITVAERQQHSPGVWGGCGFGGGVVWWWRWAMVSADAALNVCVGTLIVMYPLQTNHTHSHHNMLHHLSPLCTPPPTHTDDTCTCSFRVRLLLDEPPPAWQVRPQPVCCFVCVALCALLCVRWGRLLVVVAGRKGVRFLVLRWGCAGVPTQQVLPLALTLCTPTPTGGPCAQAQCRQHPL
jgi:hypothetical protein